MRASGVNRWAPLATALVLGALLGASAFERTPNAAIEGYLSDVATAIDAVPYRIDRYLGQDSEVAKAAVELIKPNRLLQRRYVDPETGEGFSLLVVQCANARDMVGHYPPVCYPAHGWTGDGRTEDVSVRVGDLEVAGRRYGFALKRDIVTERMDILGFFVVPQGETRFGGDMSLVDRSSQSRIGTRLGATQIQILTDAALSDDRRREIWSMVIGAIEPVLRAAGGGV